MPKQQNSTTIKRHTYNTLKKQYTEIKTIKSIKHVHIIAAKMFPKIFYIM